MAHKATDFSFREALLSLMDEKSIGNNQIEAKTEELGKQSPERYQKVWASEISHLRKEARAGMNPRKVRALERVLGVREGTLGNLLGYGVQPVSDAPKTEEEVLTEALHVPLEDWEALSDDEREFILKDARDKLEFFLKHRGGR
ncbi:MAG: hypothetical protein QME41_06720 [Actinomycetota bacterium]|nr:hypothetical protein [Actinomycetota bacterium]